MMASLVSSLPEMLQKKLNQIEAASSKIYITCYYVHMSGRSEFFLATLLAVDESMVGSGESKEEVGNVEAQTGKGLRYKLGSLSGSLFGALILVGWTIRYHPSNTQLWMVPVGLILFSMPLIVSCAVASAAMGNTGCEEPRTDG